MAEDEAVATVLDQRLAHVRSVAATAD
jgi:hypothetical protein